MKNLIVVLSMIFSVAAFSWSAEKEFKTNCATCHSIGGGDAGKTGPDLAGVTKRRKMAWIVKFIQYPTGMIDGDAEEEGYEKADPTAKKLAAAFKPAIMAEQDLDEKQIKAIMAYIDAQKKEPKGKILKVK